ncbi:MAG: threonine--tRNA ligase [Proteobacteria bacterium]|nr:threonine--tRNA ligase [Pseudomonadota bacterium]
MNPSSPSLEIMRHSCAHLLAAAIYALWPRARFGVGPITKDGFYYDIDFPKPIGEGDLAQIELKMIDLKAKHLQFERFEWPIERAIEYMKGHGQIYKVELLELLRDKGSTAVASEVGEDFNASAGISHVSLYRLGEFIDLCKGPHVESTLAIKEFKLISIAGAYWRGDAKSPQLQRIYGLCFENSEKLNERLWQIEEAKKRDHRKLAQQLQIYAMSDEIGRGLPLWLPHGAIIRQELEQLAREQEHKDGYLPVSTPVIAKESLYHRSGHLQYYKEDMYAPIEIEDEKYYLRPMNCPHHHEIYLSQPHSYRELPLRLSEYGHVYRYEASGALTGLMRTRGFCQNDAHIYCRYDQAKEEFLRALLLHAKYYEILGIKNYYMRLSLPDLQKNDKYISEPKKWADAINIIRDAMQASNLPFVEEKGEAAFYGPKIDFMIESAIGQEYAISTNQLDFLTSERFNLNYIGEDGQSHPIYVIHRAPLGSHERFVAFLLEHYNGNFPTWLCPVQVRIIPISNKHVDYAQAIKLALCQAKIPSPMGGLRVDMDDSDERMQKKILRAQQEKLPYMLILGDKEVEKNSVSIRRRDGAVINHLAIDEFIDKISEEIKSRSLEPMIGAI